MNAIEFKIIKRLVESSRLITINDLKSDLQTYSDADIKLACDNLIKNGRINIENDFVLLSDDYRKFKPKLYIHQDGVLIGYLGFNYSKGYEFAYDTEYLVRDDKPVIFSMPLEFKNIRQDYIFVDFEETLPEGFDKKILMEKSGEATEFALLGNNDYNANDLIFSTKFAIYSESDNSVLEVPYEKIKKEILGENDFPNILNIKIEIDDENLFVSNRSIMNKQKAQKIRNISLSGFQHKTAVIIDNDIMRLPDSEKREDVYYFLKPYDKEKANPKSEYYLPHLAINEHLYMSFAKNELKFDVPYTALCKKPQDDEYHFLVKYFDRKKGYKIHRKEFATIMDISSEKKYGPTSEKLFSVGSEILDENDRLRMLEYYFYSFVIKHEDMHTKNISVLTVNNKNILAPLYDISTTGIYKGFKQETALKINGKLSNIKFNDFIILVEKANIDKNAFIKKANAILYSYIENMPKYIDKLKEIDLPIYDNARAYSKTKQLYDVMKTHYEKRLNELNNNGWFVDLGIKLTGKIEYGSKFVSNDVKSILEPQIEQPLLSTQNNNIDNDCDFKM